MKNFFALLLVSLLAVGTLSGCGTDKKGDGDTGAGSNPMTGDESTSADQADDAIDGDGSAVTDPDGDGVDENVTDPNGSGSNAPGDTSVAGTPTTTGTTPGTTTGTVTKQHSLVRGATYEQMLRNGYVHDTDGDLTDHENAVTPGTVY
ncbi:MAG: hypothetical protein LKJ86_04150 [Oscillibacter sp.]|nr:hypothetical protein [Oscillibacter sp.]